MFTLNITNFNSSFKYILPEIYLASMVIFILAVSVILEKRFPFYSRKILFLNVIFSFLILVMVCFLLHYGDSLLYEPSGFIDENNESGAQIMEVMLFNNSYRINPLISFIKEIVSVLAIFCIFNSYEYAKDERNLIKYEFIQLILLATLSLFIIISANDFIVSLWV